MPLHFNGDGALDKVKREAASRLLRAAVYFQSEHMRRLNKSNPRPHKTSSLPGEYPRKRTGAGQAGVVYAPASIEGIIKEGLRVRVGQTRNSWYMLFLELFKNRAGYLKTIQDLKPRVMAMLGVKTLAAK